jgi:predicted metalloprotease
MRWDRNYTSSNVEDRRGQGGVGLGGGGLPVGGLINLLGMFGWKGILIGLVLVAVLGGGGMCMGGEGLSCLGGGSPSTTSERQPDRPVSSTPQEEELVHFVSYVFDDVQKMWTQKLEGFRDARMVLFRRGVRTACGTGSTAVGPFYCPSDQKVYIDLSFYDELRRRFGAPGDFAQAYVIAHEVGHHVQNLTNNLGTGSRRANDQIAVELQADCLAGAWANDADRRGLIETGDIDEALNAASAIGDDTLQKQSQGHVQPETWTHGSAEQRSSSFKKGYQGGVTACGL